MFSFSEIYAGELGSFEKDISDNKKIQKSESHLKKSKKCYRCQSNEGSKGFFDILFRDIFIGMVDGVTASIVEGGVNSNNRISERVYAGEADKRKIGELLIPFFKFNVNTQHVSEKIDALDLKIEIGKGNVGFEVRTTKYLEEAVNEKLEYHQFQYFHRMSVGDKIGINLGLGYGIMNGVDTYNGTILSMPILFQNGNHLGFEIRPSYFDADGVTIHDLDISMLYTYRKLAFRVGHRSLKSPNNVINGYYVGFDFIY